MNDDISKLIEYLDNNSKNNIKKEQLNSHQLKDLSTDYLLIDTNKNNVSVEKDKDKVSDDTNLVFQPNIPQCKLFNTKLFEDNLRKLLIDKYTSYKKYKNKSYISVSEIIDCPRKVFYDRSNVEVNPNDLYKFPYLHLILEVGNLVHSIIQSNYSFDESEGTIISENFKVKGRFDCIKDECLFEIKTFDEVDNKVDLPDKKHILQSQIYTYLLNKEQNKNIKNICIVYIPRSLKKIIQYSVDIDYNIGKKYLDKAKYILDCIKDKKTPEEVIENKSDCKWCLFITHCREYDVNKKEVIIKEDKKNKKVKKEFKL